jgi:hypothetical protein
MQTFIEYMSLMEQGISGPGALPGGPGGGPPGGGLGMGMPPGGGLGGPPMPPPMGGGGLGGPGALGPLGDPLTQQSPMGDKKPLELKPLDVWSVLAKLVDEPKGKKEEENKKTVKIPQHLKS